MTGSLHIEQSAVYENGELARPAIAKVTDPDAVFAQPIGAARVRRLDGTRVEIVPAPETRLVLLRHRQSDAVLPVPIERRYLFGEHIVRDAAGQRVATISITAGVRITARVWCETIIQREPAFMGTVLELYFSEPGSAAVQQIIIRAGEHGALVPGGFTVDYAVPRTAGPFLFEALVSRPGETTGTLFGSPAAYRDNRRFGLFVTEPVTRVETPTIFAGFSAEWDPGFWLQEHSENDWQLLLHRLKRLNFSWVRMMMQTKWWRRADGSADWESREMRSLYRQLEFCQQTGMGVALTEWAPEEYVAAGLANPQYAAGVAEVTEHLIRRRGFTCIRRLIVMNEPSNFAGEAFTAWRIALENTDAELRRRGLREQVELCGPDSVEDSDWPQQAARQVAPLLDAYDIHRYGTTDEVRTGELEAKLAAIRALVSATDPHGFIKPLYVMEAGMWGEIVRGVNPAITSYEYGLDMADYALQAARAGIAGISAWMLADSNLCAEWMVAPGETPPDFNWGMWAGKRDNFALRPWFYVWALFAQLFPAGSEIYRPSQPDGIRRLKARRPDGGWSHCVVNRRAEPFALAAPAIGYLYSRTNCAVDSDGFPLQNPTSLTTCPPESVLCYSSP